jgi:HEAT repeat protein
MAGRGFSRARLVLTGWLVLVLSLSGPASHAATQLTTGTPEARVQAAFRAGHYEEVLRLVEAVPTEKQSRSLLRFAVSSNVQLGRPQAALRLYARLLLPGQPDETDLLREVARSFIAIHVRDPAEHLRIAAFDSLAEIPSAEWLPVLEDGLLDSSVVVRTRAVRALGHVTAKVTSPRMRGRAVGVLKRAIQDSAVSVQIAAVEALGGAGDAAVVPLLREITRKHEGALEVFASAALVKLGERDALDDVTSAATLPDADSRMAAFGVLGRLKQRSTLSLLTQSVYDPDPSVRAFGAGALGEFGHADAATALVHALHDESPRVRSVAAASLGRLRLQSTKPLLWQAARDPVELVRTGAVEGLLRLDDIQAVLVAADLAKHPDPTVRAAAAQALAVRGIPKAVSVLDRVLKDQQPQPRLAATRALGKIGTPQALSALKTALQDSEPAIRIAAAAGVLQALKK